jgi:hypothetical protein
MSGARAFRIAQRTGGGARGLEQSSKREGSARGQSHGAIMNESNAEPAFEARQLKSAPGWYVRVAWSHGKHDHIPGFVSQQEALRWIETKARSWVSEQTRSPFRGVAA